MYHRFVEALIIRREVPLRLVLNLLSFQIGRHNGMMYDVRSVDGIDWWHPNSYQLQCSNL